VTDGPLVALKESPAGSPPLLLIAQLYGVAPPEAVHVAE
jgi:hypothetical protein